ncbi:type III secretion system cytoplasmic ring protein SctQ [Comamonas antarctica]|uniref:type III secretion system cytoplasmic ring protein SctQ n=1 Tax=Comamonas antarctica TaxID=2743470 RepID=UPI0028E35B84|nr:type III secretion system cytoplasmic ring protein SctQ [Comamonas antarctica]
MSSSPASPSPWAPLALSRHEAQAYNALAQRALALPLHCAGSDWQGRLHPVIVPAWPAAAPGDTFASIEWAGALLLLQLPAAAAQQLLSALLDGAALPEMPADMQSATLEAALDELLARLEALGRGAPRIVATTIGQAPAALPHALAWRLDAATGMQALAGMLRTDGLGLLLLAGLVAGLPAQDGALASDALQVQLHLDIGYARLEARELQQLAPGDVLLMERSFLAGERVLWLQALGAGGLHVQLPPPDAAPHAPFLTVVQSWTHAMPDLDTPLQDAADLLAIPVRLSFDLGEITLTLAELRALQPGQAIRLGHPVAGAVRVRANGALVGEGELVEIDGHLGVALRRLAPPSRGPADGRPADGRPADGRPADEPAEAAEEE